MKKWKQAPFGFTFYFTTDISEIQDERVRAKFIRDLADPGTAGVCHQDKEGAAYIYVDPSETRLPLLLDTVSHEAFHAVGFLYKYIGDKTKIRSTEETPAYLQGWLVGRIVKALGYK